jgi:hypothetical protein
MLEHTPQQDTTHTTPVVRPDVVLEAPATLSAQREAQVAAYLDHLCTRAIADQPHRSPAELRMELELRLEELTAAHRELSSDQDAATVAALQQLRREVAVQTASVGAQNVRTQKRMGLFRKFPWLRPMLLPLSLFSLFYGADATRFAWQVWTHLFSTDDAAFYRFELLLVPALVGLFTGLILRKNAGQAILRSLALLAVWAILFPGFLYGLEIMGVNISLPSWTPISLVSGVTGATFWTALGYGGAQLGSRLRRGFVQLTRQRQVRMQAKRHGRRAHLKRDLSAAAPALGQPTGASSRRLWRPRHA